MRIQTILNRVEKFKPFVVGEASLEEHDGPSRTRANSPGR